MGEDLRKRFGRLVLANRTRAKLTQQQLADRSGISVDMVNRIERGVTGARFPNIEKLAAVLNVDPAELFTP
ncbi:MAG: family transcriptional regulator, partial [Caulobacteraceae bacterium]|nr:family transcriptional regulator [Caulobacteraceae bacterium]